MNAIRTLACALFAGGLASASMPGEALAQRSAGRMHSCAETLVANPAYTAFLRGLDRIHAAGIVRQDRPVTIFALDNAAVESIPPALRNLFLPIGPEEGPPSRAIMVVDQLVVDGLHTAAALRPGQALYTLHDATVQVVASRDGSPVLRIAGYDLVITTPDQPCSNGIIQGVAFLPRQ